MAPDSVVNRYARQEILPQIGPEGQKLLRDATAVIVGLGALGSASAQLLARAGVGCLRLVDRDIVEWSNLQRQVLYSESDAKSGTPKAVAASESLLRVNSDVRYEPVVADVNSSNVERLIEGATVVVDGLDGFYSRALLNQACVKHLVPWVHGACIGTYGVTATVLPKETPCYSCLVPDADTRVSSLTCDTAGVLGPIAALIGAVQASEAIKVIVGDKEAIGSGRLLWIDLWGNLVTVSPVKRNPECPVCGRDRYPLLDRVDRLTTTSVCGKDAVQVTPNGLARFDFAGTVETLRRALPSRTLEVTAYLARMELDGRQVVLFRDGRAMVFGTSDPVVAKSLYTRYFGG